MKMAHIYNCLSWSIPKPFVFDGWRLILLMILRKQGAKSGQGQPLKLTKLSIKKISNNGQSGTVSYQRMAI